MQRPVTLDLAVRIGWQPHEEAAVWIQRELEKIGFKINITRQTDATFRQLATKGDHAALDRDLAVLGQRSVLPPRVPLFHSTSKGTNTAFYIEPGAGQDPRRELPRARTPTSAWPPPGAPRRSSSTTRSGACCGTTTGPAWCASDLVGIEKRWDTFERYYGFKRT